MLRWNVQPGLRKLFNAFALTSRLLTRARQNQVAINAVQAQAKLIGLDT